jgi:hypothetical protein
LTYSDHVIIRVSLMGEKIKQSQEHPRPDGYDQDLNSESKYIKNLCLHTLCHVTRKCEDPNDEFERSR